MIFLVYNTNINEMSTCLGVKGWTKNSPVSKFCAKWNRSKTRILNSKSSLKLLLYQAFRLFFYFIYTTSYITYIYNRLKIDFNASLISTISAILYKKSRIIFLFILYIIILLIFYLKSPNPYISIFSLIFETTNYIKKK